MTEKNVQFGEGDKVTVRKVPHSLVKAYSEFIEVLPESEREVRIAFNDGAVTQVELVEHLQTSTSIGKSAARAFLEGTRLESKDKGIQIITEKELVRKASEEFRTAAEKLRSRQE
jgi:hypothetical protein